MALTRRRLPEKDGRTSGPEGQIGRQRGTLGICPDRCQSKEPQVIVLVTGATSGFGHAITRRFIADGERVVAVGRRQERLDELAREMGGGRLHTVKLDVRDNAAINAALTSLPTEFAAIDVLVNNAGLALGLEPAHKAQLENWDEMVDTNIKGVMYLARAVLPGMVSREQGLIINIGSVAGNYAYPGGNVYGASKAFVHMFSLNLRADLIGTRVRVTDIQPGLVGGTEFSSVRFQGDQERVDGIYRGANALTPDDVAEAVHWVAHLPPRVNINTLEMMPVSQTFGPLQIHRAGPK
jgi:3-hydroxy acid dehydrogenase/malonic semialdehyde reductase